MDIGIFAPLGKEVITPEYLRALGPAVEDRGFESLWVAEHVVLFDPDSYDSEYPYSPDGKFPAGGDGGIAEPFTALTYLAALTDRIRLGTGICLVAQRNPTYTAKVVADLDRLSNGRVDFGIGVGWLEEEFEAVAMPFEKRGQRTNEHLDVMKTLWTDEVSEFEGELYNLRPCRMYPKPVQTPHPPIHVGGESTAALTRVAERGNGWYSFNRSPQQLSEPLATLDAKLEAVDRARIANGGDVQLSVCPYFHQLADGDLERYAEAGVDRLILLLFAFDAAGMETALDGFVTNVLEPANTL